ncbi:acyloxyacyl hydrolase [Fodinibius sediminis]|uniref:Lipid A 3-O-deacylase (PagL) n=1 Tax=Fodinibius sediminis TaxID=1214077 RepID=A0A521CQW3_9BACT|nr:acyloxyacyl hydrolase [Fodinibius sediminis]SMO61823.1 Lipid A 3-O-deacylase (PagL) [Fodinibius sediminis]
MNIGTHNLNTVGLLCFFICVFWGPVTVQGQAPAAADSVAERPSSEPARYQKMVHPLQHRNEVSLWAGFAFDSFRLWGKTQDARIRSLGLRYKRKLLNYRNMIVEYGLSTNLYSSYSYQGFEPYRYRSTLSGFGISPLGFQANFITDRKVQPFINTSAGLMFMEAPFPDDRGKKLNFTFYAGGGLEIMLSRSVSLSLGIKYHHLSNGDRGQINPGVDSNFYYTSITIF